MNLLCGCRPCASRLMIAESGSPAFPIAFRLPRVSDCSAPSGFFSLFFGVGWIVCSFTFMSTIT